MASFAKRPSRIILLAAEPSADALGASLAQAWLAADPSIELSGMAGPLMRAAGVKDRWQSEQVSVMGLWEVLKAYPRLKKLQNDIIDALINLKPDMVIGIDGPDFNLPIEAALKAQGVAVYHWVAPTVWAWRAGRAEKLARQTDGVLCLFPFEPPYFEIHGMHAAAVGHPLADRLPIMPDKLAAKAKLGLQLDALVFAVLPGSRRNEWHYHGDLFFEVVRAIQARHPTIQVVVPCLHERMQQVLVEKSHGLPISWVISSQGASDVLVAADVALVASGTATLETAFCHTPMVVAYRLHWLSYHLMKWLMMTRWIALPNILTNRAVVPELIQSAATVEAITQSVDRLLVSASAREDQVSTFITLHQSLRLNAAQRAYETLLSWWKAR